MKLYCTNYVSPIDTEGTYSDVYIEDVFDGRGRKDNTFYIDFEMYILKNDKRVVLDKSRIAFRGSNADLEVGLPTTNRKAIIKIPQSSDYVPEIITSDEEGNTTITPAIGTPEIEIGLLEYLYANQGQMPSEYEVIDWGFPTCEDAMNYFSGGQLIDPELFLNDKFAQEWLKHNLQMKGQYITQFEFI